MKKVSLIITVLNEEKTIVGLLKSVRKMNVVPDEVIIVDGGSVDNTVALIKNYAKKYPKFSIISFIKRGNRSASRNYAIKKAKNNWISITDAGCILDKNWLKELVKKQKELGVEVVAGYYKAITKTQFEEAVVPYVLVMPDKVDEDRFLPATRSMLLDRRVWRDAGGFDESLSDNEDYAFAKKLESNRIKIGFARKAVVGWIPRATLKSFLKMIFRFARGDIRAGIIRPKVILIFFRYLFGIFLILWGVWSGDLWILFGVIPILISIYILWSINKNYRYVSRGWYWLPVLQISADLAVMWGSVCGLINRKP